MIASILQSKRKEHLSNCFNLPTSQQWLSLELSQLKPGAMIHVYLCLRWRRATDIPPHTNGKQGTSTLQCCVCHIQPWNNIAIVFAVFPCRLLPVLLFLDYGHEDRWGHFPSSEQWGGVNGHILGEMWGQQDMIALCIRDREVFQPCFTDEPLMRVWGGLTGIHSQMRRGLSSRHKWKIKTG